MKSLSNSLNSAMRKLVRDFIFSVTNFFLPKCVISELRGTEKE